MSYKNARLRNRIEVMCETLEARIQRAVEEAVSKAVEPLHAAIAEKDKEILWLKSQLDKRHQYRRNTGKDERTPQ